MRSERGTYLDALQQVLAPGNALRLPALVLLSLAAAVTIGLGVALVGPVLAVAVLGAGISVLVLVTDPLYLLWCALAVIVLLPFATLPMDIGVTPTFLEIGMIGAAAITLVRLAQRRQGSLVVSPVGWPLLLFIGLGLTSFVLGLAHAWPSATSLRRFADIVLSLGFFYLVLNLLAETPTLMRTYRLLLLMGGAAALIGIALYVLPRGLAERLLERLGLFGYPTAGVLRYIEDDPAQAMRAIGTSVDPNVFGGLLAFMGGLVAPQLFLPKHGWRRWLAWVLMGAVGLALLLTFSRGSMFGLAVALSVLGLLRHRKLLVLLAAAAILVLVLPPTQAYVLHFLEGARGEDLATQMRFGEYKDAFLLISRYPWFGVGFTGVPDVDIYLGVSSVYLLVAEEMGVVGLSLFLAALASFFAYSWPRARLARGRDAELEALILGAQTAVLTGAVAGVLDHYLFNLAFPHAAALLWGIVAIGTAGARLAQSRFASGIADGLA